MTAFDFYYSRATSIDPSSRPTSYNSFGLTYSAMVLFVITRINRAYSVHTVVLIVRSRIYQLDN